MNSIKYLSTFPGFASWPSGQPQDCRIESYRAGLHLQLIELLLSFQTLVRKYEHSLRFGFDFVLLSYR